MTKGEFSFQSKSTRQMLDLTDPMQQFVSESGVVEGIFYLYTPHTTSGLVINEGADPDVQRDILGALDQIVPSHYPYRHNEGNSPAHLMASMTGTSLTVFISHGHLQLGTWQRMFFCEFDGPRSRKVWWKIIQG